MAVLFRAANINIFILLLGLFCGGCAKPKYELNPESISVKNLEDCELYFASANLCADLRWVTPPSETEAASFLLTFYHPQDPAQLQQPPGELIVAPFMEMGHGTAPTHVRSLAQGTFLVEEIYLFMPGEWIISLQLNLNQGQSRVESTEFRITL